MMSPTLSHLPDPPSRRPSPRSRRVAGSGALPGLLSALVLVLVLAPAAGQAAPPPAAHHDLPLLAQANGVSLDQAVAQVRRRTGGRVLSAETQMSNGVPIHHIRVLTSDQRVRTIRVDGRTGEWL
jgi:hypothetical protein